MNESTQQISFESSPEFANQTGHGLMVVAYEQARALGVFMALQQFVTLKMKKVDYSVQDKLATLLASILVGCQHTSDINIQLGPQEQVLAQVFGFERFPDQSTINRTLTACLPTTVEQARSLAHHLHTKMTRARQRRLRTRLGRGHGRVLFIDLDQRGIVVSGKHYEVASPGFFGRKRQRRGYQLSLAYIGGQVGEVLDEFLDAGNTPAGARMEAMLERIVCFATQCRIPLDRIVVRADGQYGTPTLVEQIRAKGLGFLVKGISTTKASVLGREQESKQFEEAERGANHRPRWVMDLGVRRHRGKAEKGVRPETEARTILIKWQEAKRATGTRPGAATRAKRAQQPVELQDVYAYLLTSLTPEQATPRQLLDFYDDRACIERYFRDEQGALGARSVRTHRHAGAAVFQWFVAIANNLLRHLSRLLVGTPLESYGVQRLVTQVFQVPALLVRSHGRLRVLLPERHLLTKALLHALSLVPLQPLLPFLTRISDA